MDPARPSENFLPTALYTVVFEILVFRTSRTTISTFKRQTIRLGQHSKHPGTSHESCRRTANESFAAVAVARITIWGLRFPPVAVFVLVIISNFGNAPSLRPPDSRFISERALIQFDEDAKQTDCWLKSWKERKERRKMDAAISKIRAGPRE